MRYQPWQRQDTVDGNKNISDRQHFLPGILMIAKPRAVDSRVMDSRISYRHGETVILGLDPASTITGYSVIRGDMVLALGTIRTKSGSPEAVRIWQIFNEIIGVVHEYGVTHGAIETFRAFYLNQSRANAEAAAAHVGQVHSSARRGRHDRSKVDPAAMFLMKAAQTATQMALILAGIPLFQYAEHEWKGGRGVRKETMRERAEILFRIPRGLDLNITDALMIAHHHSRVARLFPENGVLIPDPERHPTLRALESFASKALSASDAIEHADAGAPGLGSNDPESIEELPPVTSAAPDSEHAHVNSRTDNATMAAPRKAARRRRDQAAH